jgi:hypothetical protein
VRRLAIALLLAPLSVFACSKSDSPSTSSSGGATDSGADANEAGSSSGDGGGDASCLPAGQPCETTCCPPATCVKSTGAGTCCLPKGALCTDAKDCCIVPGMNVTCAPGDGGLVCTQKPL